jgi:hypothetical protein
MVKGTLVFYFSVGFQDELPETDTRCRYIVVPWHRRDDGDEQPAETIYERQELDNVGDPRWMNPGARQFTPEPLMTELFRRVTTGTACPVTETADGVRAVDLGRILVPRSV